MWVIVCGLGISKGCNTILWNTPFQFQFRGFSKINGFAAKILTWYIGKLLLSLHFAIEEGTMFGNKIFIMFFMFLRQITVKILV